MSVTSLHIINYKNFSNQKILINNNIIAVLGDNGMGKTNILDAIYYTCIGKSYFTSSDKNVISKNEDFFRIVSTLNYDQQDEVIIKVKPGNLKTIEVNSVKLDKISEHIGSYPVVMIAPIDIQLLLEGSEARRLFINNCIVQYSKEYLTNLLIYNRLLKQRNALLKQFAERRYYDGILLDSISDKMGEPASVIYQHRKEFINKIRPIFDQTYKTISGGQEDSQLTYKSDLADADLKVLLERSKAKDRIMTRTCIGVHKDDLVFEMDQDALKTFASQGQLKSFILSLKLSQYHLLHKLVGKKPILLLDDLFDKLDTNRVTFLLQLLTTSDFGQVVISDTDIDRIPSILSGMNIKHQVLQVKNGSIIP